MSDCPNGDIRDLLPDFLHDGLAASERALVEAHLRDCALCRQELALLRGMRAALRHVPVVDVHRIVEAIPPYRAPSRQVSPRSWGGWRIAAAITLLAAGGTSIAVARRGASTPQDSVQVARVERGDSLPASAHVQGPVDPAVSPSARAPEVSASPAPRELALAGSTIGDLDDQELSALIDDIGSLHAVTPVDVDNAASISPIAPTSPSGMNN